MMKSQKKRKSQNNLQSNTTDPSMDIMSFEMPTADVVAAERASEAAYERALAALGGAHADGSDSGGSDGEARLRNALHPLHPPHPQQPPRAPPPAAAALLVPLAAALRDAHAHNTRFLDDYLLLLEERTEAEVQAITEELMGSIEGALSTEGAGSVVLVGWLGAALAWRGPRVPRALPALLRLLQQLTPHQVTEAASALHAALRPRDLLVVSDAVRGAAGGAGLAERLLRAALAKLLGLEPDRRAGGPDATEVHSALTEHWSSLDAAAQLDGLALAGRVLATGPPEEAGTLLATIAPPPPRDSHDPDYLKVSVAVKTLQNLFKDM